MLTLRRVTCENFRLLRNVSLDVQPGVFFIRGVNEDVPQASSNMSGKSTLLSAITWALYGVDSAGESLADSAVSDGETACRVHLEFEQQNGQRISVVRDRSSMAGQRNLAYVCETAKYSDALLEPADLVQGRITSLVGAQDVMLASNIFGYDECYVPFARSGDRAQKRLFDLLVSASDLDAAFERACIQCEETERELLSAQQTVASLSARRSTLLEVLHNDTGHEDVKRTQETFNQRLLDLRGAVAVLNSVRAEQVQGQAGFERSMVSHDAAYEKLRAEEKRLEVELGVLAEQQGTAYAAESALAATHVRLDTRSACCPTCHTALDAAARRRLLQEHAQSLHRFDLKRQVLERGLVSVRDRMLALNKKRAEVVREEAAERQQIAGALANVATARVKAKVAKRAVMSLENADRARRESIEASVRDVEQELNTAQVSVLTAERSCMLLRFWREAFGPRGIRAYRLDKITPVLNSLARSYSHRLFGDGMRLVYSTQTPLKKGGYREAFDCCLVSKDGTAVRSGISAGQSMRRDIIHAFAMCRLAQSLGARRLNLIAFDELFRTLDARGVARVMELLREEQQRYDGTIWVVEHNDDLASMFEHTITVRRSGNIAVLSQG